MIFFSDVSKGCGKNLKKGNIILSIKCGGWNLDKQKFNLCEECRVLQENGK